jgi:hypothetical protein
MTAVSPWARESLSTATVASCRIDQSKSSKHVVVALGHSNAAAKKTGVSGFLAGTCVVGELNGTSIMNVDCSRAHNARIDQQLTDPTASCSPGDDTFVPQSPNPSLCLNFNDHNP